MKRKTQKCTIENCNNTHFSSKGLCEKHRMRLLRHGDPNKTLRFKERGSLIKEGKSFCSKCRQSKDVKEFTKNKTNIWANGLSNICKLCHKSYNLIKNYDISEEEYNNLAKLQNYKCALCKEESINRFLSVDHNHKTNRLRGLLCSNCNTGLGLFKENINLFYEAIKYIQKDLIIPIMES